MTNDKEIEVNEGPDGRWFWSVGNHSGEERTRDEAYERARDVQRRLSSVEQRSMTAVKTYGWLGPDRLKFINDNPKVVSLLYDLGLLPEEISARVRGYVEEEREKWRGVLAMAEQAMAAHPCNVAQCPCRELRENFRKAL